MRPRKKSPVTATAPARDDRAPHPWLPRETADEAARLHAALVRAYRGMREGPVIPARTHDEVTAEIGAIGLDEPIGLDAALAEAESLMESGDLRSSSARCFGYFNPSPAWPAVVADALTAARNPQLAVTSHAPASTEIERRVIRWLTQRIGLPASAVGHFTSGGSEANATSLMTALAAAHPGFSEEGVRALGPHPVFYASEDCHLAWVKIARSVGLGTRALALVECDGDGRLDPAALETRIQTDVAQGRRPVMVVATAGTTNAGALDPIAACREIATRYGTHLHVDAAWAGALVIDPTRRPLLAGIELADSITIDAHKWFNATMGAGMVFVRDHRSVARAFGVQTGYMPEGDGADAYIMTNQWSRRLAGLRLWMTLRAGGVEAYRRAFDAQFALADRLRRRLRGAGWEIRNESPLPVVLFGSDLPEDDSDAIANAVNASGRVWLGCVAYRGRRCLRACITSFLADHTAIDLLVEELDRARRQAGQSPSEAIETRAVS